MNTTTVETPTAQAPDETTRVRSLSSADVAARQWRRLMGRYGQFVLYTVIGGSAVVVDVGIFAILSTVTELHILLANAISTGVALVYSFLANTFGNFKVTDRMLLRFASFAVVSGIGFVVSSLVIAAGVWFFALNPIIAKGISLPIVLVLQFALNKSVTFGSRLGRPAP